MSATAPAAVLRDFPVDILQAGTAPLPFANIPA
jgi:hypothetical protein